MNRKQKSPHWEVEGARLIDELNKNFTLRFF